MQTNMSKKTFENCQFSNFFDLREIAYKIGEFSISEHISWPRGMFFDTTGRKMFILDYDSNTIYSCTLNDCWNLFTAEHDHVEYFAEDESSRWALKMFFDSEGTRMFVLKSDNKIYSHVLKSPWNLSTASYENEKFDLNSQDTMARGMFFSSNGKKMYVVGADTLRIYSYTLSIPWKISTAIYDNVNLYIGDQENLPTDLCFSFDGTKMYVVSNNDNLYCYELSIPWDISTAKYRFPFFDLYPIIGGVSSIFFSFDGKRMYVLSWKNKKMISLFLEIPFETHVPFFEEQIFSLKSKEEKKGMFFNSSGTKMFVAGEKEKIHRYTLNTPWDISTLKYDNVSFDRNSHFFPSKGTFPGMFFRNDGTKLYALEDSRSMIYSYSLDIPWNLSSAKYDFEFFSLNLNSSDSMGIFLSSNGKKLFVIGNLSKKIYSYTLSVPWDISSASYDDRNVLVDCQDLSPKGIFFSSNGEKMYLLGDFLDSVYSYTLTVPWDISTAIYDEEKLKVYNLCYNLNGFHFDSTGTFLFVIVGDGTLLCYEMSVPWKISTAKLKYRSGEIHGNSIFLSSKGERLFILSNSEIVSCSIRSLSFEKFIETSVEKQ